MIYGVVVRLHDDLIQKYCFGLCGKIMVGALEDSLLGSLAVCTEQQCPYKEKELEGYATTADGEPITLRKLKWEGE